MLDVLVAYDSWYYYFALFAIHLSYYHDVKSHSLQSLNMFKSCLVERGLKSFPS